jgi:hypothetical protein
LQLSEINQFTSSDVQWEIKGTKVIPKSLNVAKLTSESFAKTIIFNQIRRKLTKSAFDRRYNFIRELTKTFIFHEEGVQGPYLEPVLDI